MMVAQPSFSAANIADNVSAASSVRTGDFDQDGDLDIIVASEGDNKAVLYTNDGASNPSFSATEVATGSNGIWALDVVDLDSDGDLDVLAALHDADQIRFFQNNGSGGFTNNHNVGSSGDWRGVHSGDIDGDGDIDFAAAAGGDNKIFWFENDGSKDGTGPVATVVFTTSLPGNTNIEFTAQSELRDSTDGLIQLNQLGTGTVSAQ